MERPGHTSLERIPNRAADATASEDPGKRMRAATGTPVVPAFDGFRAYGILGIVLLHILGSCGVLASVQHQPLGVLISGTLGQFIDILFVISGFVVFLPTAAHGGDFGNWGSFAIRRAARLVPAFWLVLALLLVLIAVVPTSLTPFPPFEDVVLHLGFLHGVAEQWISVPIGFGVDGPLWTLSVEATFYVLLPFIAAAYFRRPLVGLILFAVLTAVWKIVSPSAADFQFPAWAFSFGVGMTGAWLFVRLRRSYPAELLARRAVPVQAVSLVSLAVFAYLAGRYAYTAPLFFVAETARHSIPIAIGFSASLGAVMVSIALGPELFQRPFAHPAARWLGDISYGIYLIHAVVIFYAIDLLDLSLTGTFGDFVVLSAIVLPISIGYGYLSARLVEQPIRRWAHRFGRGTQRIGNAPVVAPDSTSAR